MNNAQSIERYLKENIRSNLSTPISFAEFNSLMNQISHGRIDAQITEEIWGQLSEAENPPTLRRFTTIFIEAIQRVQGKLAQLDQQLKEAQTTPPLALPASYLNTGTDYLVFRVLELCGAATPALMFEFEQNGKRARVPFNRFRDSEAIVRGYDRSAILRVKIINATSGAQEAAFELFPAEVGYGKRTANEKMLSSLGSEASVFFQTQIIRSTSDYINSVRAFNEENSSNIREIKEEFARIKENLTNVFPSGTINYAQISPMLLDNENQFNFRNNSLKAPFLCDMSDAKPTDQFSAQKNVQRDNVVISMQSYDRALGSTSTAKGVPNRIPPPSSNHGEAIPTQGFERGKGREPMNLSPFAASVIGGPGSPPPSSRAGPVPRSRETQSVNGSWNKKLKLIHLLCTGLTVLALCSCLGRPAFVSLLSGLVFLLWYRCRDQYEYHIRPIYFMGSFAIALILDLFWALTQMRRLWARAEATLADRVAVLSVPVIIGIESAITYFLFLLNQEGIYASNAGAPLTTKKPPLDLPI